MENQDVRYLTEVQVSRLTGLAVPTLRNQRHLGRGIPYIKLKRAVRYNSQDVLSFMESRKVIPHNVILSETA